MEARSVRRVVTGHDANGKAIIQEDGPVPRPDLLIVARVEDEEAADAGEPLEGDLLFAAEDNAIANPPLIQDEVLSARL